MKSENPNPETVTTESQPIVEELAEELTEEIVGYKDVIETVISSLDQEDTAMVSHTENGNLWKFQYGTVEVFVQLTGETDDDIFTAWASVLKLPAKNELGLFRKLLEMNWSATFETCFGIFNEQVVILAQRTVAELSPGEISRVITLVANIADENDEALKAEFGGT